MAPKLAGVSMCMLGGDLRELELAKTLLRLGVDLRLVGFVKERDLEQAKHFSEAISATQGCRVVLGPMSNTDLEGRICSRLDHNEPIDLTEVMPTLAPKTFVFLGVAKPVIRQLAAQYQLELVETAEIDEVAILNSIPTAEGAIQLAMEELPITVHGSRVLVVGFGRCGITVARDFQALGADVTVAARSRAQLARAAEMQLRPLPMQQLFSYDNADLIVNTVPALVITRPYLRKLANTVLIIDLAAAPGGVDFDAAGDLGMKAVLALSLPGKVAPITAGRILSQCIPRLLQELLGGEEDGD